MNDKERVQEFIIKATGKTIGRNTKLELSTLFANTYAEYIKSINDINKGYTLFKELDDKISRIKEEIKDVDSIPTEVITTIIEEVSKEKVD